MATVDICIIICLGLTQMFQYSSADTTVPMTDEVTAKKLLYMEEELMNLKKEFEAFKARALQNNAVGFTALLTSSQSTANGNVVVFEQVLIDTNGDYDAASGKFTCPVSGIYYAHITMTKECCSVDEATIALVVLSPGDEVPTTQFNLFIRDPNHSETVSSGATVLCEAGGKIWIQGVGGQSIYPGVASSESLFSVFKIDATF